MKKNLIIGLLIGFIITSALHFYNIERKLNIVIKILETK